MILNGFAPLPSTMEAMLSKPSSIVAVHISSPLRFVIAGGLSVLVLALIVASAITSRSAINSTAPQVTKSTSDAPPEFHLPVSSKSCGALQLAPSSLSPCLTRRLSPWPQQDEIARNGRSLYRSLLRKHGPVIVVPRCGRREYLVDGAHAKRLFTEHSTFLFEPAILQLMNLEWAMSSSLASNYVADLAYFIQQSMNHMPQLVDRVAPAVYDCAKILEHTSPHSKDGELIVKDIYGWAHHAIARATVPVIYGDDYFETSFLTDALEATANSIRRISGVDRASSWLAKHLPTCWKYTTLARELFCVLLPRYYLGICPFLWLNLSKHLAHTPSHSVDGFVPVFSKVCQQYFPDGLQQSTWSSWLKDLKTFLVFNTTVMLGMAFGSIHQSANNGVWILFYLAQRPDYIEVIRNELRTLLASQPGGKEYPTSSTLSQAVKLDAFIHETMRHKGDTFGPPRQIARNTRIGPYVVPAGANIQVILFTTHGNPSLYPDPTRFDPTRALGNSADGTKNKPASMATEEYLPFGLSRWACPGRFLAVNEMKILVASIVCQYDVRLEGNTWTVRDPITTTAVAPIGTLRLRKLEKHITGL